VLGDYAIQTKIGEGAEGKVYVARHRKTGKLVAIKMVSRYNRTLRSFKCILREIQILRKLSIDHPSQTSVVRLLDVVCSSPLPHDSETTFATNQAIYMVFDYYPLDLHTYIT
jgi:serine/threonine protein kinase